MQRGCAWGMPRQVAKRADQEREAREREPERAEAERCVQGPLPEAEP